MRNRAVQVIVAVAAFGLIFAVIAFAGGIFDFAPANKPAAATQPQPAKPTPAAPAPSPSAQPADRPALAPTAAGQAAPAAAPSIIVAYARYGSGDRWADVTEPCKRLIRDNGLKFPRDMHHFLGADPVPGRMKFLELSLVINGTEIWLTVADNLQLDPLNISTQPPPEPK
jgi:hypothetical protein